MVLLLVMVVAVTRRRRCNWPWAGGSARQCHEAPKESSSERLGFRGLQCTS